MYGVGCDKDYQTLSRIANGVWPPAWIRPRWYTRNIQFVPHPHQFQRLGSCKQNFELGWVWSIPTKMLKLTSYIPAKYQATMLRSLRDIQGDDGVVGFYQSAPLGAFFRQSLIEMQAANQTRMRHGGIVLVHGKLSHVIYI